MRRSLCLVISQSCLGQGSDYGVAVTEEGDVYTWGGGGYGPLGHPKPKLPEDDEEMEAYLEKKRELVSLKVPGVPSPAFASLRLLPFTLILVFKRTTPPAEHGHEFVP